MFIVPWPRSRDPGGVHRGSVRGNKSFVSHYYPYTFCAARRRRRRRRLETPVAIPSTAALARIAESTLGRLCVARATSIRTN